MNFNLSLVTSTPTRNCPQSPAPSARHLCRNRITKYPSSVGAVYSAPTGLWVCLIPILQRFRTYGAARIPFPPRCAGSWTDCSGCSVRQRRSWRRSPPRCWPKPFATSCRRRRDESLSRIHAVENERSMIRRVGCRRSTAFMPLQRGTPSGVRKRQRIWMLKRAEARAPILLHPNFLLHGFG